MNFGRTRGTVGFAPVAVSFVALLVGDRHPRASEQRQDTGPYACDLCRTIEPEPDDNWDQNQGSNGGAKAKDRRRHLDSKVDGRVSPSPD